MTEIETALGHRFAEPALLRQALTHPSAAPRQGHDGVVAYERLEFLGDRVLGLVIADLLVRRYPDEREGALAHRQSALVSSASVARVAEAIGLPTALVMAKGEDSGGGRANQQLLGDAGEAIIGALYTDAGFEVARAFVERHWAPLVEEQKEPPKDPKMGLQEWAQGRGLDLPTYTVADREGPDHAPRFKIRVTLADGRTALGEGPSKRTAEQAAARRLLEML